jgi:3-hydroxyisobutyrate dehydrogenase-like beta-hydroxyacid dehydrogenase
MTDSQDDAQPVSVLGLGMLGAALARAFLAGGHPTTVWNRSPDRTRPLAEAGATPVDSVPAAVAAAPLVVVCVSTYEAAQEVLAAAGDTLSGRVVLNLSSGTPELARQMSRWVAERGASYLDGAAMSGTAAVGRPEALFLFSGAPDALTTHLPTLSSLGRATDLGSDPGLASLYDTALFGMAWGLLAGFHHAAALVSTSGVKAADFAGVAGGHLPFLAGLVEVHGRQVDSGRYPADDGTVAVHAAAMEHLIATSKDLDLDTDLPTLVLGLLERAATAGHATDGFASVAEVLRQP